MSKGMEDCVYCKTLLSLVGAHRQKLHTEIGSEAVTLKDLLDAVQSNAAKLFIQININHPIGGLKS